MSARPTPFEARYCPGTPADCVDYGVISHVTGKEVCRVWLEDDARQIEALLNEAANGNGGQDRKFAFRGGQFVNRVSGEAIPVDEPVILFRARDNHALPVLREYLTMASDPHHRQAIKDRMGEFAAWRAEHPGRVKEPGITHHIRLNDEPRPDALYLIRKRGAFYRPNAEGYTINRAEAGRYTLAEAISHSHPNGPDGPRDGIDYMLANDPPASHPCKSGEGAGEIEAEKWRHKLWMVACHATGGGIPEIEGIDRSVNDICVQITQSRNMIYQAGKDATISKPDVVPLSSAVETLIAWARDNQAFPEGNSGGEGRGHIDENERFVLRDLVGAIDATHTREAECQQFAKIAECAFDDRPRSRVGHPSQMDWEDGYRDGTRAAAAAIRATLNARGGA